MLAAITLNEVVQSLQRYADKGANVRLVCLVFARPDIPLADEIFASLPYFDRRSGEHSNFYFGGIREHPVGGGTRTGDQRVKMEPGRMGWVFNPTDFNEFRAQVEAVSEWEYSGGTDLILMNARVTGGAAMLDFGSTVSWRLEELKRDGVFETVSTLFEQVCRFADKSQGDDPTWGFSNAAGVREGGSALKELLLTIAPAAIRENVRRAAYFANRDLRPRHRD